MTNTFWNSSCVVLGVLGRRRGVRSGLLVSNGSKLRYTPTVSPLAMVPPTARSAVSCADTWTLSLMLGSTWFFGDQTGRDQLVAGLEVRGRDRVSAHVLEVVDRARLHEPARHLLRGDRGLDGLGIGTLGDQLVDDVDVGQGFLGLGLVLGRVT